jgi:fatty acid desaturase
MKLATRLPAERSLRDEDADQIAEIRVQIIAIGDEFRARHPWIVRHQDAIGLAIFIVAVAGVVGAAVLYVQGLIPWWVCIPVTAFWLSIVHEIEHDLIHWMYFRQRKWIHRPMLFVGWILRPNNPNPWIRRAWHLHHHSVSGTESDIEERLITNGQGWGGHRLLTIVDHALAAYARPSHVLSVIKDYVEHEAIDPDERRRLTLVTLSAQIPFIAVHYFAWHAFIALHAYELLGGYVAHGWAYHALNVFAVVLLAPNALRSFCLLFVSSNMHYYGDIEEHNVFKQTQVWTAKRMWPFQAFCFNFGGTHAIHHFVVRDPFYIRQAIADPCHEALRAHGVRFNDFGTFRRANRWMIGAPVKP